MLRRRAKLYEDQVRTINRILDAKALLRRHSDDGPELRLCMARLKHLQRSLTKIERELSAYVESRPIAKGKSRSA